MSFHKVIKATREGPILWAVEVAGWKGKLSYWNAKQPKMISCPVGKHGCAVCAPSTAARQPGSRVRKPSR
jgi:hypothetical protein